MQANWESLEENDMFDESLYEKILSIENVSERNNAEAELFKRAKKLRMASVVQKKFNDYKKEYLQKCNSNSYIVFGDKAPIVKMKAPGYYKDSNNQIRTLEKNTLVTSTMLEPILILKNFETGEELVKCAFFNGKKWNTFIIPREVLMSNGKITRLANKGVDVSTESSSLLIRYIRDLLNNNDLEEVQSTSKMGWHDNEFLPYDGKIEFDGEESFSEAFKSLQSKGDYKKWYDEISKVRIDNVPLKLVMATSFASPLLEILDRQSFATLIWGKSGGKKTVAGRIAMSIWGDSREGKLFFNMDNTMNFFYRTAEFFNHLPVFFDEYQRFKGDVDALIMKLTGGIDRGRATAEGGIEKSRTWKNAFIFTGEDSISTINSGGGTLNRLIEIYITKDVVEDGIKTCDVINDNYGFAGKIYINYLKSISKEKLNEKFLKILNSIKELDFTEEKQAINMAMLMLANELACDCIFKEEKPLEIKDIQKYMFTKKEIDKTERAYEFFLDECDSNKNKFNLDTPGEFWGIMDDFEITIISQRLRKLLEDNKFNYKKVMNDWEEKGYIERNSSGKFSSSLSRAGRKGNYIIVKVVKHNNENKSKTIDFERLMQQKGIQLNVRGV